MLRLADSRTPAQGGIGGTVGFGAFGLEQSQAFGDVKISAVLNPSGDSDDIVNVTRGHGGVGVYGAGIDFSSGRLETFKLLPGGLVPIIFSSDQPNQGSQPRLTNLNRSYFLELTIVGKDVNARVFDSPGGNQLLHGYFTDNNLGGPTLQPSIAGVSVAWIGTNSTNLSGTWDNLSAVAIRPIPEPSSAVAVSATTNVRSGLVRWAELLIRSMRPVRATQ
jgi:hypothetical protein